MSKDWAADQRAVIAEELSSIGSAFEPDELAYLALTIKVENQIRNRLAWRLHQRLQPQGLIVARDWIRADLAILDADARPMSIIAAKAMQHADARSDLNWRGYATRVQSEARKNRKALGSEAQMMLLAVSVAVHGAVERSKRSILKHVSGAGKSAQQDADAQVEAMAARLRQLGAVQSYRLADGQAFKLQVRVDGFLVGPL